MLARLFTAFLAISAISLFTVSCVDQEFDTPPGRIVETNDISNTTIQELIDLVIANNGSAVAIPEGTIIKGEIISDDNTGNMYKVMIIQDGTAGITLSINEGNLSTTFERGRIMYVDCGGLGVGNFNGLPQIGVLNGVSIERMEEVLLPEVLIAGTMSNMVEPRVRTIKTLTFADLNTLIRLDDVEFADSESGNSYATPQGGNGENRTLEDCDGNRVVVRNSDFSTFAGATLPEGNGSLTAVYSVYSFGGFNTDVNVFGGDAQLMLRDLDDVDLTGERCDGSGGGGGGTGGDLSIASLRSAFGGSPTTAPSGSIQGVVISDITAGNTLDRNLYMQDGTGGIAVRFAEAHNYQLGDELKIEVGGVLFEEFNGLLQLNELEANKVSLVSSSNLVTPQAVCVEDLIDNSKAYESTLVVLKDVSFSGGSIFSDNGVTVSDESGSIGMFTWFDANFSDNNLPSNNVDLYAVANNFNGPQIFIRNASDILTATSSDCQGGGGGGGGNGDPVDGINLSFDGSEGGQDFDPVTITDWQNTVETGNRNWQKRDYQGNGYAQATAYNDDDPSVDTWLITPQINMDVASRLNFDSATAFHVHDGLTVYVSTDFDGDVTTANWDVLSCNLANASTGDNNWVNSGDVDLSAYTGLINIAWRYEGTSGANTSSYRVDNIVVD